MFVAVVPGGTRRPPDVDPNRPSTETPGRLFPALSRAWDREGWDRRPGYAMVVDAEDLIQEPEPACRMYWKSSPRASIAPGTRTAPGRDERDGRDQDDSMNRWPGRRSWITVSP